MEQSPFISLEHWIDHDFERQYRSEAETMLQTGDIELLPDASEMGIIGIDGREYPIPSMDALVRDMTRSKEQREWLERKMRQGFTTLDLTPFATPIERAMVLTERLIRKHHAEGKLFATRKNPLDQSEPLVKLDLDTNQPLFVWDKLIHGDVNGELKYFPTQFDTNNHGGITKQQLLDDALRSGAPFPGWDVSLQEANLNIPRQGKGKTIGGRKQLETNQTPIEYLKTLQTNPMYQHESGMTVEQWLKKFRRTLAQTNQVIDDYQGNGSLNYLIGQYHPASDYLPSGNWLRDVRRAGVGGGDPWDRYPGCGVCPAVRFSEIEV